MEVLIILGYVLLILVGFLLLLLIVPTKYSFTGEKYDDAFIKAKVSILLGLIGFYYYNDFEKKNVTKVTILGFSINISSKNKKYKSEPKRIRIKILKII